MVEEKIEIDKIKLHKWYWIKRLQFCSQLFCRPVTLLANVLTCFPVIEQRAVTLCSREGHYSSVKSSVSLLPGL